MSRKASTCPVALDSLPEPIVCLTMDPLSISIFSPVKLFLLRHEQNLFPAIQHKLPEIYQYGYVLVDYLLFHQQRVTSTGLLNSKVLWGTLNFQLV